MPTKKAKFDEKNFCIKPEDAALLRGEYLKGPMSEYVRRFMNAYPAIKTVVVKVAQYYDDEAGDAVHFRMYPTVLSEFWTPPPEKPWTDKKGRVHTPSVPDWYYAHVNEHPEMIKKNLPFWEFPQPNSGESQRERIFRYNDSISDMVRRWEERAFGWHHWLGKAGWDSNGAMIPLFSAFCAEGGRDEYKSLAVYRRLTEGQCTSEDVSFEFIGEMIRPECDGIRPEREGEEEEEPAEGEEKETIFSWVQRKIAKCAEIHRDPLVEMREHVQRRDIISSDDERHFPPGIIAWNMKGPGIRESEGERFSQMDDALRELQEEWARRDAWDAGFNARYGKK